MADTIVRLEDVSVAFDGELILDKLNLEIKDKEFVTLLGPSGCGKTTTLRIIGGFTRQDEGNVFFAGKNINEVPAYKRNINTVFQKYALFPHLNVYDNVAFGLRIKKAKKEEIDRKVKEMLKLVDLAGFETRNVTSLSGGQQQRVAIARALINRPNVLLLDEPLGALDLKLRKDMQLELKNMQQKTGITFVYVTHDQEEALTMSDTVVVMNKGVIQQIGSPIDIYNEPKNAFVADFVGESNIFDGQMSEDLKVTFDGHEFVCVDPRPDESGEVDVVIRPEDVEFTAADAGMISGKVESCLFKGVHYETTLNHNGNIWLIHSTAAAPVGETIGIKVIPENIHIMKKMYGADINTVPAEVLSEDDDCLYTVLIDGVKFGINTARKLKEEDNISIRIRPDAIDIVAADEGDMNGYIDSVIWKADHYELLVETENRRFKVNRQIDEQAGTVVGLNFDFSEAEILSPEV